MSNATQNPQIQRLFQEVADEIEVPADLGQRLGSDRRSEPQRSRYWATAGAAAATLLGIVAIATIQGGDQEVPSAAPPVSADPSIEPRPTIERGPAGWGAGIPSYEVALDLSGATVTFDRGSDDGLAVGMPVVDESGLIGKVSTVTDDSSTVVIITQPEFSIDVRVGTNPNSYSVSGTSDGGLVVRGNAPLDSSALGQTVITTGGQSSAPPGIPVGVIDSLSIDAGGEPGVVATVRTLRPFDTLKAGDQVRVLRYRPVDSAYQEVLSLLPEGDWVALAVSPDATELSAYDSAGRRAWFSYVEASDDIAQSDLDDDGTTLIDDDVLGDGVAVNCYLDTEQRLFCNTTEQGLPALADDDIASAAAALLPLLREGTNGPLAALINPFASIPDMDTLHASFAGLFDDDDTIWLTTDPGVITTLEVGVPSQLTAPNGSATVSVVDNEGTLYRIRSGPEVDHAAVLAAIPTLIRIDGT